MSTHYGKKVVLSIMILGFAVPAALMFWSPRWGIGLLFVGILIALRCMRLMQAMHLQASLHPADRARSSRRDRGQTVFVQLTDEHGNDLPQHEIQAKLAAARMHAGPRDMVIGVRHTTQES